MKATASGHFLSFVKIIIKGIMIFNVIVTVIVVVIICWGSMFSVDVSKKPVCDNEMYTNHDIGSVPGGERAQILFDDYSSVADTTSFWFYYVDHTKPNEDSRFSKNSFVLETNYGDHEYENKKREITEHTLQYYSNDDIYCEDDYTIYEIIPDSNDGNSVFKICFNDNLCRIRYVYLNEKNSGDLFIKDYNWDFWMR